MKLTNKQLIEQLQDRLYNSNRSRAEALALATRKQARAEKAEAERDAAVQFLTEAVADLKLGERDYTSERGKECLAFLAKIKEGKL